MVVEYYWFSTSHHQERWGVELGEKLNVIVLNSQKAFEVGVIS